MNWTPFKPVSIVLKSTNLDSRVSNMKEEFRSAQSQIVGTRNPARNYKVTNGNYSGHPARPL